MSDGAGSCVMADFTTSPTQAGVRIMTHLLPTHAVLAHFAARAPRRQREVRHSSSSTKQTLRNTVLAHITTSQPRHGCSVRKTNNRQICVTAVLEPARQMKPTSLMTPAARGSHNGQDAGRCTDGRAQYVLACDASTGSRPASIPASCWVIVFSVRRSRIRSSASI